MKTHTPANPAAEPAASREPRTSSLRYRHTTNTRRVALPLPVQHMAPPQPSQPVRQCRAASRRSCRCSLGISFECCHSLPAPHGCGCPQNHTELGSVRLPGGNKPVSAGPFNAARRGTGPITLLWQRTWLQTMPGEHAPHRDPIGMGMG